MALNVFHQGKLTHLLFIIFPHQNGDCLQFCQPGSPQPPFPGNQFIIQALFTDNQRLDDTVLFNRFAQFFQFFFIKGLSGLVWIGPDTFYRNFHRPFRILGHGGFILGFAGRKQGFQSSAQTAVLTHRRLPPWQVPDTLGRLCFWHHMQAPVPHDWEPRLISHCAE